MAGFDVISYAASKKYAEDITKGITMIEGKPCTIASITEITGGHRVTYRWTANDGTTKTQTMDVMDGVQGPQGVKGDTGNTGATGAQGPAGVDGTSATIRVGNVTSGATPTITNSGTNLNAVFDFVLPKGDKGDKGDKGEDGQNGSSFSIRSRFATEEELIAAYPDGPENEGDAYFVGTTASPDLYIWLVDEHEWHNNGPIAGVKGDKGDQGDEGFSPVANVTKDGGVATITIRDKTGTTTQQVSDGVDGDDGQDGADGKSAYDIAVDEGFVGTKGEWLASLKGETGAAGTNGTNGTNGVSPVANVTKTDDVYKIHIEDSAGTTEEEIDMSDYQKKDLASAVEGQTTVEGALGALSTNKADVADITPIGVILPYGGTSAPVGWMICDGTSLLRASYPELFAVIGTAFGSADSTHFNIPDMTGKTTMGVETGHALGASEVGALPNIKSAAEDATLSWASGIAIDPNSAIYSGGTGYAGGTTLGGSGAWNYIRMDASRSNSIYTDGQTKVDPANVRVNYIIKAV